MNEPIVLLVPVGVSVIPSLLTYAAFRRALTHPVTDRIDRPIYLGCATILSGIAWVAYSVVASVTGNW
jgi:hypothetical protein